MDSIKILEKANGRAAMIGFMALMGAYLITGEIIRGSIKLKFLFIIKSGKKLQLRAFLAF
tara:strand:+ start:184 stop:363 length:180 start_codon:yes stop_codon:yes gene_type:complete